MMRKMITLIILLLAISGCASANTEGTDIKDDGFENKDGLNAYSYDIETDTDAYMYEGLTLTLKVFDEEGDVAWTKTWEHLYVEDTGIHSDAVFDDNYVSIVVDSDLYKLDKMTGEEI